MNEKKKLDIDDLFWKFMAVWTAVLLTGTGVYLFAMMFKCATGGCGE